MLEEMLEKAKKGEIKSCSAIYVDENGEPVVVMCNMSIHSPDKIVGILERLKFTLLSTHMEKNTEEIGTNNEE